MSKVWFLNKVNILIKFTGASYKDISCILQLLFKTCLWNSLKLKKVQSDAVK